VLRSRRVHARVEHAGRGTRRTPGTDAGGSDGSVVIVGDRWDDPVHYDGTPVGEVPVPVRVRSAQVGERTHNGSVFTLSDLGSGKAAALNNGDTTLAQNVVNRAIKDVANLRGRIGAFQQNVLGSTVNSLNVALENVSSSNSAIRDTDFASETSNLTRNQILVQAATNVLSQANQSPQAVLKLLG